MTRNELSEIFFIRAKELLLAYPDTPDGIQILIDRLMDLKKGLLVQHGFEQFNFSVYLCYINGQVRILNDKKATNPTIMKSF